MGCAPAPDGRAVAGPACQESRASGSVRPRGRGLRGPLSLLGAAVIAAVAGTGGSHHPAGAAAGIESITVQVAADRPLRPISPLIYGLAAAGPAELAATGATVNRWGGNPSSRYNWELGNAWNAARDWEFRNGNYGRASPTDRLPSGVADRFVAETRAAGAEALVTIPALGWVARDDRNETRSIGVPAAVAPPSGTGAAHAYDPAANRLTTSLPSFAHKPAPFTNPPDLGDGRVYQDEWVHHLTTRFGAAAAGGVAFYAVDNEPDLWADTHADVRPVPLGYDALRDTFLAYATAIKAVDPSAKVMGPSVSGWTGYVSSPRDAALRPPRIVRALRRLLPPAYLLVAEPDKRAHGGQPFLPWWLEQMRQHEQRTGRRMLDVLDVHYYPQAPGVFAGATDAATNALRLRSTRALWDPGYVDESWIGMPVRLIPRLRGWIDRYYPGTQLSIGEWNWGADGTANGALAIADVLGIFGREGVDVAAYWAYPIPESPGALAFAMYTNADGHGGGFGDVALPVRVRNANATGTAAAVSPDIVSAYASLDSGRRDVVVVVVNKRTDAGIMAAIELDAASPTPSPLAAQAFQYAGGTPGIRDVGAVPLDGSMATVWLPPASITTIRLTR